MPSRELIAVELKLTGVAREIAMRPERFDQFIRAVKRGTKQFPIKVKTLEEEFGVGGESIRKLRAFAQCMGYEVGSDMRGKNSGYFWAQTETELADTEAQMYSRYRSLGMSLNAIRMTRTRLRSRRPDQPEQPKRLIQESLF